MATDINLRNELFCKYYTQNQELFGNATHSYGEAYEFKLDSLSHDDAIWQEVFDEKLGRNISKCVEKSSYDKAINVCAVEGARLLRTPKIQVRLTELLNELLEDSVVDSQLAKLIMQDSEPATKIAAIREYNKIRNRIVDHVDHTTKGDKVSFSDGALSAAEKAYLLNLDGTATTTGTTESA